MNTSLPNIHSPTHDEPRITKARFIALLKTKDSPMLPEAGEVYDLLVSHGVEPAFALAQFRVESQYGTAGHAAVTHSIGNMLWDDNLTTHAVGKYAPGNGYTYARYNNYVDAATDYVAYIHWYRQEYGLDTIYKATARWLGRPRGSTGHVSYTNIIVSDIYEYQFPSGTFFEVNDMAIHSEGSFDRSTGRLRRRYTIVPGTRLYRGTTEASFIKTYSGVEGDAWYMGPAQGSTAWGMVLIGGPALPDPKGTWVYIKGVEASKIKTV